MFYLCARIRTCIFYSTTDDRTCETMLLTMIRMTDGEDNDQNVYRITDSPRHMDYGTAEHSISSTAQQERKLPVLIMPIPQRMARLS